MLIHNPRCSKSREALALLQAQGVEPEIRLYLQDPLTAAELSDLLKKLGKSAREVMRSGEDVYKTLALSNPKLSEAELINFIAQNPILLERPIFIHAERAVIGRPPENILAII